MTAPSPTATAWFGQNAGLVAFVVAAMITYALKAVFHGTGADGSVGGSSDCSGDGDGDGGCD